MASATDVREWAKAEGIEIGEKGRIKASITERYEAEHGDPQLPPDPGDGGGGGAGGDYDHGVSEADFPAAPGGAPEPAPGDAQQAVAEQAPRKVARARRDGRTFSERLWGGGGTKARRPAKKQPRVSLKGFAEDMFLDLAWTFQGLP